MIDLELELLQVAVGKRSELSHTPTAKEWNAIYQFAEEQAIVGVMFGGVERLGETQVSSSKIQDSSDKNLKPETLKPETGSLLPPMDLLMDWLGQAEYIKTQNEQVNVACRKAIEHFEEMGCDTVILKGQSNARKYKVSSFKFQVSSEDGPETLNQKPETIDLSMLRTSGDIDIWCVKRGMSLEESRKVMAKVALEKDPKAYVQPHHVDYPSIDGICVELHFTPSTVFSFKYNKRVQRYFEDALGRMRAESLEVRGESLEVRGESFDNAQEPSGEVREKSINLKPSSINHILPVDVDVVFQLMHLRRHLICEGIGLRQVCDLYFTIREMVSEGSKFQVPRVSPQKIGDFSITGSDPAVDENVEILLKHLGLYSFARAMAWVLMEVFGDKAVADSLCSKPDEKRGRFILDEILKGGNFGKHNEEKGTQGTSRWQHMWYYTRLALRCVRFFPRESLCNPLYRLYVGWWKRRFR